MRLAVITDVHGNLPALQAALAEIDRFGVDLLIHTGDAMGIGPFPRECIELLIAHPATDCLLGNHDAWYAFNMLQSRPQWMGPGEWQHQQWTHAQVGAALRPSIAAWPYTLQINSPAGLVELLHFPRNPDGEFILPSAAPKTGDAADALFQSQAKFVFYGHDHQAADLMGATTRYVNPGSLGCAAEPVARIAFLVASGPQQWEPSYSAVRYDPTELLKAFDQRAVPERDFIQRVFMPFGANTPPNQ